LLLALLVLLVQLTLHRGYYPQLVARVALAPYPQAFQHYEQLL
jgi:hypothetical protein